MFSPKKTLFQKFVRLLSTKSQPNARPLEAAFKIKDFELHKLDVGPPTSATLTRDDAMKYYRQMKTIRYLETNAGQLYKEKFIHGALHLYSGQTIGTALSQQVEGEKLIFTLHKEACCVGVEAGIRPSDTVVGHYRAHGWVLVRGLSPRELMAELFGRTTGCSGGRGGSMHTQGPNFNGIASGVLGANVSLATGHALAKKYAGSDDIAIVTIGDGAANQGQIYESFNMAKLWDLPIVYIIENNQYGMSTPIHRCSANTKFYTRGDYIPGLKADGSDVLATREAAKFCAEYSRSGKGPIILELDTYRFVGHSVKDADVLYRTQEEKDLMQETSDPIKILRSKITDSGLADSSELEDIGDDVEIEIDEAIGTAKMDPLPSPDALYEYIYKHTI